MLTYAAFMIESAHFEWPFPPPTPIDWSDEDAHLQHESRDLWKEDFNVTVVLNPWHRPRLLANQLKALHEQVYMHKHVYTKKHMSDCVREIVCTHTHTQANTHLSPPALRPPSPHPHARVCSACSATHQKSSFAEFSDMTRVGDSVRIAC
jgi:hypothetical protein